MSRGRAFIGQLQETALVGDGANGARLYELGCDISSGSEVLNLTQPDIVRRVHEEYVDVGAALVETNTFAANSIRLQHYGMAEKMQEINHAGTRLALEAAGSRACVSGSVGPVGIAPGDQGWDEGLVRQSFREQISTLCNSGVHLIQLETFTRLDQLLLALEEAKAVCGNEIPVIAQMLFGEGGSVGSGENGGEVAARLMAAGADIVGVNCGLGVSVTIKASQEILAGVAEAAAAAAAEGVGEGEGAIPEIPVSAYPNAGYPESIDGRLVYMATPEYLAQNAVRLAKLGVRLLGGCCGTRPETIRAIAMALTTLRTKAISKPAFRRVTSQIKKRGHFKAGAFLDNLKHSKPIIAEIDPPSHLQIKNVLENIRLVADAGADAVSLAENPLALLKMGNIALASIVRRELKIPTICHLTCRDRNLLGLQSTMMGAHILDIDAILAVTGDPVQSHSSNSTGRSVYDVNSVGLVRLLAGLNRGVTSTGVDLKGETDFSIGVAFNSAARNLESEVQHLQKKVDEGARFIMTQPVFDADHGRRILELTKATGLRVFLGFFPLVSARSALYLHNEVPGIMIPEEVLKQLTSLENPEDQEKVGTEITGKLLENLLPDLDGVYLISPFNRARVLAPLIRMVCASRQ